MSCYSCRKQYGFFTKEVGCPNCGYSFCVKCLKCTAAVPRHGGKELKVCVICYDKLKLRKSQKVEKVIDVDALPGTILNQTVKSGPISLGNESAQAAVALLEDAPPTELGEILLPFVKAKTQNTSDGGSSEINNNLDIEITKRLKNLKDKLPTASDAEIRERLTNLTGMPMKDYANKNLLFNTDKRTDQQKMEDLLKEFLSENELDKRVEGEHNDAIADIERRLRALRDMPLDGTSKDQKPLNSNAADAHTPSDNEEDDETILKNIMQKYLAEAALPQVDKLPKTSATQTPSGLEELPWCNICNDDAVIRCKGCHGDLFCQECFNEIHDDEEYLCHEKEKYTAPPHFKENHF